MLLHIYSFSCYVLRYWQWNWQWPRQTVGFSACILSSREEISWLVFIACNSTFGNWKCDSFCNVLMYLCNMFVTSGQPDSKQHFETLCKFRPFSEQCVMYCIMAANGW